MIEVLAYDNGFNLRVRCPFCQREHIHGRGGIAPEVADAHERRGELGPALGKVPDDMYGGRGSHCVTVRGGGYTLVRAGVDQKRWPRKIA